VQPDDELSKLSYDQLLEDLGSAVVHEIFPRDARRRGAEIYKSIRDSLQDVICGNAAIENLARDDDRRADVLAALADLIAAHVNLVPAFTVAELLMRDHLHEYCARQWTRD
jgi:hypothetical protein